MANLSDLIIQHPEVTNFDDLVLLIIDAAKNGERFLHFDVKPDYRDTPRNWELKLESAFYWGDKVQS
ncbi:MAG: sulfur relay protein DsrC [Hyphomicrobiales bacterium]|nr:MAG: sulfur relay protein DsrC [Hyphomicrobiales bacterium]